MNKDELKKNSAQRSMDGFVVAKQQVPPRPRANIAPRAVRAQVNPKPIASSTATTTKQFPLPRYEAPERPIRPLRKRASRRMLVLRGLSLAVALFVASGGFLAWKGYHNLHKVFRGTSTVAALASKPIAPNLLNGEGDGRVNILLLGIGGPGHDGPDLTDTMVVLSVDPVNHAASMVSIPRDLWVKMPVNYFGSQQKINAAYESGKYHYLGHMDGTSANAQAVEAGFKADDQVVKEVLDVNINYHVLVNFQAFQQAIDTVGGVTVNVPNDLIDPTFSWMNHGSPVIARAGVQQMNGYMALEYARSRETSSDFARGERQRQLLVALKDKVLTVGTLSNPAKIDGLMNAFGNNVYSDLSTQGAMRLMNIMKQTGDGKITSVGLTDKGHQLVTTDRVNNASVVRPLAGFGNYGDIQTYVRSQIPDGYIVKEHAPVVVYGPSVAAAAADTALLTSYGYTASSGGIHSTDAAVLVDLSGGKDPYTLHYLQDRYGVKAVKQLPTGVNQPSPDTKFVIISPK